MLLISISRKNNKRKRAEGKNSALSLLLLCIKEDTNEEEMYNLNITYWQKMSICLT